MASDDHVATAQDAFAKEIARNSRTDLGGGGLLTPDESEFRRHRLQKLAIDVQAMAASPRSATYKVFEQILQQAQGLGAKIEGETIIAMASAFMQRPHVRAAGGPSSSPRGYLPDLDR
jgi:hypothetical protein